MSRNAITQPTDNIPKDQSIEGFHSYAQFFQQQQINAHPKLTMDPNQENPNWENLQAVQPKEPNQIKESNQSKAEEADEGEEVKQGYDILKVEELNPLGYCDVYAHLTHLASINIIYSHSRSPITEEDGVLALHQILEIMYCPPSDLPSYQGFFSNWDPMPLRPLQ